MMAIALTGFRRLYERYGYFKVTSKMIGVNVDCMVKVWVSENMGSARPDCFGSRRREGTEKEMAVEIVNLIWSKTECRRSRRESPYDFMMQMYSNKKNELDLKRAFYAVIEYALKYSIKPSMDMSSVFPIISQMKSDIKCNYKHVMEITTRNRRSSL